MKSLRADKQRINEMELGVIKVLNTQKKIDAMDNSIQQLIKNMKES